MNRKTVSVCIVIMLAAAASAGLLNADDNRPIIAVRGLMKQPSSFTARDLGNFQQATVRLNEVTSDRTYRGSFTYRGVPLKSLVEMCAVEKEESPFYKPIDLAIVVRSRGGKKAVLSWGEVMYRNAGDAIIALSGEPVMPLKNCAECHKSPA